MWNLNEHGTFGINNKLSIEESLDKYITQMDSFYKEKKEFNDKIINNFKNFLKGYGIDGEIYSYNIDYDFTTDSLIINIIPLTIRKVIS